MEWLNLLREAFLSLQRYLRGGHVAQNVVLGTRPITTEVLQAFAREIAEEDEVPLISPFHVQFMPSEEPPADETVNEQSPDNKDAAPTAQQDEEVPVEVEEPADDDKAEKKAH
ncbi:hypothetical protein AAVH_37155 [Aphelenchoides avenae]|nr:hypothetical protein AAVH_37155 [Aphelenchus avenae]